MAKNFRFNLFQKKGGSFAADVVVFFNTYAKYIIIVTQLIVLSVFFIKIVLDQGIIDLKESIDQKNQIILAAMPMIGTSTHLSSKIDELNRLIDQTNRQHTLLTRIFSNVPSTLILKRVSLGPKGATVDGNTLEASDVKRFQVRLQKQNIGIVQIEKIQKDRDQYLFTLTVK